LGENTVKGARGTKVKSMLKSSPIFRWNGAHLVEKKMFRGLNALNMQKHFWLVSNFENVSFAINGKYSKTNYDNPNYYVSFLIFQTYKNVV
jgi:hypothetical protein